MKRFWWSSRFWEFDLWSYKYQSQGTLIIKQSRERDLKLSSRAASKPKTRGTSPFHLPLRCIYTFMSHICACFSQSLILNTVHQDLMVQCPRAPYEDLWCCPWAYRSPITPSKQTLPHYISNYNESPQLSSINTTYSNLSNPKILSKCISY